MRDAEPFALDGQQVAVEGEGLVEVVCGLLVPPDRGRETFDQISVIRHHVEDVAVCQEVAEKRGHAVGAFLDEIAVSLERAVQRVTLEAGEKRLEGLNRAGAVAEDFGGHRLCPLVLTIEREDHLAVDGKPVNRAVQEKSFNLASLRGEARDDQAPDHLRAGREILLPCSCSVDRAREGRGE